jgi:sugar-specific transcriptional regulator TrmB
VKEEKNVWKTRVSRHSLLVVTDYLMENLEVRSKLKSGVPVSSSIRMPNNPEVVGVLRRLGLNQYEAKAYYALSVSGNCTAGKLSEAAALPRPRVYDVLDRLQGKGFVALKPGRPVEYAALPLLEAVKTLKKQKENSLAQELKTIEDLTKNLQSKMKSTTSDKKLGEEVVWTLKGLDSIHSKMNTMLQDAREHIIISSTGEGVLKKIRAHQKELEAAKTRGVKIHVVAPTRAPEVSKIATSITDKLLPTRLVLADDQALLFLTGDEVAPEDEVGLWLQSPHVAATFKQLLTKR